MPAKNPANTTRVCPTVRPPLLRVRVPWGTPIKAHKSQAFKSHQDLILDLILDLDQDPNLDQDLDQDQALDLDQNPGIDPGQDQNLRHWFIIKVKPLNQMPLWT